MAVTPFLSLADVKTWLNVTDAADDVLLGAVNTGATVALITAMGGDPRSATRTERVSGLNANRVVMNYSPITAVSAVSIGDVAQSLSGITFDDNLIYLKSGSFPRGQKNITVTYTAGYGADDIEPILLAHRYTVKAIWEARDSSMNVSSESFSGVVSQSYWQSGPGGIPPQAQVLISSYVRILRAP